MSCLKPGSASFLVLNHPLARTTIVLNFNFQLHLQEWQLLNPGNSDMETDNRNAPAGKPRFSGIWKKLLVTALQQVSSASTEYSHEPEVHVIRAISVIGKSSLNWNITFCPSKPQERLYQMLA